MNLPENNNIRVQRTRRGLEIDLPTTRFTKYSYKLASLLSVLMLLSVFVVPTIHVFPLNVRYKFYMISINSPDVVLACILLLSLAENFLRNRLFSEKIVIPDNETTQKEASVLQQILHPDRIIYLSESEAAEAKLIDNGEEKQLFVANESGSHSIAEKISTEDRIWVWRQLKDSRNAELTLLTPEDKIDDTPLPLLERLKHGSAAPSNAKPPEKKSGLTIENSENVEKVSYSVGRQKSGFERVYVAASGLLIFAKTVNSDIPEINRLITIWNRIGFDAVIRRGTELDNAKEAVISLVVGLIILFIFLYFARKQRPEVIEIQTEKILVKTGAQPTGPVIKKGRITEFIFGDFLKPKRKHQLSPEDLRSLSNEENQLSFFRNGKRYNFAVGTNRSDRDRIIKKLKSHSMINL